ncbi:hypothetical protein N7493_008110 [Penicillium malachiteum]|uniref:FAD-binding domain-containing protein n=1 Tax=Penicillium malachiteum TaxID=1324776 RepID=A0AAD6MTE3_9EURO|nr:hypothetical protein N7493_008110 [Penicillium malachiteum]
MDRTMENPDFRVLIVGGSIAGLTLANSLSRAGIDFLVLEAHDRIVAPVGASLALTSNGAMILDQMNMYEDIAELFEPVDCLYTWLKDGQLLSKMDTPKLLQLRHNYPMAWIERQDLLHVLLEHLEEKDKVLLSKRVTSINDSGEGVIAYCADGTSYNGSMIAGADGVHSTVRTEMWRHMDISTSGNMLQKDKTAMVSEYSCVFGISNPTHGIKAGEVHRTWSEGFSIFVTVGKEGQVFWLLYAKLNGTYHPPDIPRYTTDDLDVHLKAYSETHVTKTVKFAAVCQNITSCSYVPLEEANYDYWTWGVFACLGDAIHKVNPCLSTTPNLGQGASLAIENAASLANHIVSILKTKNNEVMRAEISSGLNTWASVQMRRTKLICLTGNMLTRLETFATLKYRLVALYLVPYAGDLFADLVSMAVSGTRFLDFLPVPERCVNTPTLQLSWYIRLLWALCLRLV